MCKKCLTILLLFTILLSACGRLETIQGDQASVDSKRVKTVWTLQEQELPDVSAAFRNWRHLMRIG